MKNCMKSISVSEIPLHKGHYVYILRCSDGTLYTGYTTELRRRVEQHNEGTAAKYTRGRTPVELVYMEEGDSRSWGLKREHTIKQLSRINKVHLIRQGGLGNK